MTSLQPLPQFDLALAPARDAGKPPSLEWLPVKHLFIDPAFQRDVSRRGVATITRIANEFTWARFAPVIVAKAGKGETYSIIDGQHRTIAAVARGHRAVPCSIVEAGGPEQARIFAAVNGNVTPVTPMQLFKASRAAGEEWAMAINRVCTTSGIKVLTYPRSKRDMKPLETMAVGTLRKAIIRFGEEDVGAALKAAASKPGASEPGIWNSMAIEGAIAVWREEKGRRKAPASQVDTISQAQRIRELKGRGFTRFAIQAALGVKMAEIEAALTEART